MSNELLNPYSLPPIRFITYISVLIFRLMRMVKLPGLDGNVPVMTVVLEYSWPIILIGNTAVNAA